MEKAKITDITFDMEDAKLLALQTDLLLKARAIHTISSSSNEGLKMMINTCSFHNHVCDVP